MMDTQPDELAPLTKDERRQIRALLEQDKHVTWLWSTLGVWFKWGVLAAGACWVFWDRFRAFLRWLDRI